MNGVVKSATLVRKNYLEDKDLVSMIIDLEEVYYIGDYTFVLNELVGSEVNYNTVLQELADGRKVLMSTEITIVNVVNVVKVKNFENFKLEPLSNILSVLLTHDVTLFRLGEVHRNVKFFIATYELKESLKTQWVDLGCYDRKGHFFLLRAFIQVDQLYDVDEPFKECVRHYCVADIKKTRFGLQTENIEILEEEVEELPSMVILREFVRNTIKNDKALVEYIDKFGLLDVLSIKIDGGLPGFTLYSIAAEILQLQLLVKFGVDLNYTSLLRAIICTRGYMAGKNLWGESTTNASMASKIKELKEDVALRTIIAYPQEVGVLDEKIINFWNIIKENSKGMCKCLTS